MLPVKKNTTFFKNIKNTIVWLGHASFFIRMDGFNILTDPVFTDSIYLKRKAGLCCGLEEIQNIDYILVSHSHFDHYDSEALETLLRNNPKAKGLVPLQMGEIFHKHGPNRVEEAGWWQQYTTPSGIEIDLLPAKH